MKRIKLKEFSMQVIKRNGEVTDFNPDKIYQAILKAAQTESRTHNSLLAPFQLSERFFPHSHRLQKISSRY